MGKELVSYALGDVLQTNIRNDSFYRLYNGMIAADRIVNNSYLIDLNHYDVEENEDTSQRNIRLFKLEKLVYDSEEDVNDKLVSVYSALQDSCEDSTIIFILDSNGEKVELYLGVKATQNVSTAKDVLCSSFLGNFPGSILGRQNIDNKEIARILDSIVENKNGYSYRKVSCVTSTPAMRDEDKEKFVQGMEKFIDTMRGKEYSVLILAKSVTKDELRTKRKTLENIYSSLSPFLKTSISYGENESTSVSDSLSTNFSNTISNGTNCGGQSSSTSTTEGSGTSHSDSSSHGTSNNISRDIENKQVTDLLGDIDKTLTEMKNFSNFGCWNCAAYFLADNINTSVVAANTYKALLIGDSEETAASYVNSWDQNNNLERNDGIIEYLKCCSHPVLSVPPVGEYSKLLITPGTYVNGKTLPLILGLPRKSVNGLTVTNTTEFGRNVFLTDKVGKPMLMGQIYHMGRKEQTDVNLDLDILNEHCFITGSTGSGKSNTTNALLYRFYENGKPFLVIEPAKGEYKDDFGKLPGINIFCTNPLVGQMLKVNPFKFAYKGIHILEHLDRLIEIFNACWEMSAAMPAILKESIERIYIDKGWDLLNSEYIFEGEPVFPSFSDLLEALKTVIDESDYSSETKGNYIGALVTRTKSLTKGIAGQIFCDSYDIDDEVLFDQNTIVDLSKVGSLETKSLIMGIIILKLSEYRMSKRMIASLNGQEEYGTNSKFMHATILEEAHNLLKRVPEGGNPVVAKSVEMICNSIAEMRTYGEGFIIVDQSPSAVDIAAIKNTNTKIIMRVPEKGDCEAVGNAIGLSERQIKELPKLEKGVAVVMQRGWNEAVLTKIIAVGNPSNFSEQDLVIEEKYKDKDKSYMADAEGLKKVRGAVIDLLLKNHMDYRIGLCKLSVDEAIKVIDSSDVNKFKQQELKSSIINYINICNKESDINKKMFILSDTLYNLSCCKGLFDILESTLVHKKLNAEIVDRWKKTFLKMIPKYVGVKNVDLFFKILLKARNRKQCPVDYYALENILLRKKTGETNNE